MERREILRIAALATGVAVIGGESFLMGCKNPAAAAVNFTPADIALLDEIGDTIIPTTPDSAGAKATKIGEFMKLIVTDCFTKNQQTAFTKGLGTFKEICIKNNKKSFEQLTPDERKAFLMAMEKEAKDFNKGRDERDKKAFEAWNESNKKKPFSEQKDLEGEPSHYYSMFKQLSIMGYFSSEIGATKALRNVPVPGRYDGAFPYKKGDKAFS